MGKISYRRNERKYSLFVYAGLFVFSLFSQLVAITSGRGGFSWDLLLVIGLGAVAVAYQDQAGFPALLQRTISNKQRFLKPLFIGMAFAIPDIVLVKFVQNPGPYTSLPPWFQPFPYSILHYTTGAIFSEVYYRLLLLTLCMALTRNFVTPRYHDPIFWILAVLTSLWEPLLQWPQGPGWFVGYSVASGIAFNLLLAWLLRKTGFLASLFMRLGHYLLWHILLGLYVEWFEIVPQG